VKIKLARIRNSFCLMWVDEFKVKIESGMFVKKREPVSFRISGSHQGVGECHREISHWQEPINQRYVIYVLVSDKESGQ